MKPARVLAAIGNPARQNRFSVDVFATQAGIRIRGIRCITATIPGRAITTTQFGEMGSGPKRAYPTGLDYDGQAIALTFICDDQFIERQAIEAWQESIYNRRYGLNYPEEYYGTMKINQLDRNDAPIYSVELHEVWPQGMVAQELNMTSSAFQTFTVNFNYRTWSSQFENVPSGILGGLFQKTKRKIGSRIRSKLEDIVF